MQCEKARSHNESLPMVDWMSAALASFQGAGYFDLFRWSRRIDHRLNFCEPSGFELRTLYSMR